MQARMHGSESGGDLLRVATILGSTRSHGTPPVLSGRVGKWVVRCLESHGAFEVDVIDPLNPDKVADLPLLQRPHFTYSPGGAPEQLEALSERLKKADCYLFVTPEYNHMPSPALLNIINHFGASTWAFKPSAVASYSAGQWGGTRAAIGLRTALLEVGALPVSAMIHVPSAGSKLDRNGIPTEKEEIDRWNTYADRTLNQLEWWATAARNHRILVDPNAKSPAFTKRPSQRNAPEGT